MNDNIKNEVSNLLRHKNIYDGSFYEKDKLDLYNKIIKHHYKNSSTYKKFINNTFGKVKNFNNIQDIPYLPSSIFKQINLFSIKKKEIFRIISSSATSGKKPSKIHLDKFNNKNWTFSLQRLLIDRIGNKKFCTLLLDEVSSLKHNNKLSARSSMSQAITPNSDTITALLKRNKNNQIYLDLKKTDNFFKINKKKNILIFAFTYVLYKNFLLELKKNKKKFNLSNLIIVHAGGWKKLEQEKVGDEKLKSLCCEIFGIKKKNIIDLYGFTEQGGLLYPDCEHGNKHVPVWSSLIIRDKFSLKKVDNGKIGLLQFLTPIQTSYPGHSILTQDLGYINKVQCKCNRKTPSFKIVGRNDAEVEVRGCGDIMSDEFN